MQLCVSWTAEQSSANKKQTVLMWDINANNLIDNKKLKHLLLAYGITQMRLHHTKIPGESSKSIKWICTNINTELINTYVISSGLFRPFNIIFSTPKYNTNKGKERKRTVTKKYTGSGKPQSLYRLITLIQVNNSLIIIYQKPEQWIRIFNWPRHKRINNKSWHHNINSKITWRPQVDELRNKIALGT